MALQSVTPGQTLLTLKGMSSTGNPVGKFVKNIICQKQCEQLLWLLGAVYNSSCELMASPGDNQSINQIHSGISRSLDASIAAYNTLKPAVIRGHDYNRYFTPFLQSDWPCSCCACCTSQCIRLNMTHPHAKGSHDA